MMCYLLGSEGDWPVFGSIGHERWSSKLLLWEALPRFLTKFTLLGGYVDPSSTTENTFGTHGISGTNTNCTNKIIKQYILFLGVKCWSFISTNRLVPKYQRIGVLFDMFGATLSMYWILDYSTLYSI